MKKKSIFTICLALILALACSACSQGQQQDSPAEEPETSGEHDLPDVRFFDASLLDGSAMTAEELYGSKDVTVINCWATWCPPCLEEMDDLAAFAKTLPDNVQLVSFCVDGTTHTDECQRILEEAGFEGTVMIDAGGDFRTLLEQMQYVPTTLFVDSMGRLVCDSLIGAPDDLPAAYKERINIGLKAAGKSAL